MLNPGAQIGYLPGLTLGGWVFFKGTFPLATFKSSNVTIVRTGAGIYTVTFTSPLPTADFIVDALVNDVEWMPRTSAKTVNGCTLNMIDATGVVGDPEVAHLAFMY